MLAVAVVAIGGVVFAIAMAVIAALALSEFYSLTAAARPLRWAGDLGTFLTIALAWGMDDHEHGLVLGVALSLGLVAVAGLIVPRRDEITTRMATTLLGVIYLGVPFAILVIMRDLPTARPPSSTCWWGCGSSTRPSYFGGRLTAAARSPR